MTDSPHADAQEPTDPDDQADNIVEAEVIDEPIELPLDLPEDPAEAVPVLIGELMASRSLATEATDNWKRAVAEFDNFRKRFERDQAELISRSSERVVSQLLPVLDSLDVAMSLDTETENEAKMLSGMASTRELLLATLAREGVEPIKTTGAPFDPALHEAVQIADGEGTMVVADELRRGYTVRGKVLRASLVAVGYTGENGTDDGHEGSEVEASE